MIFLVGFSGALSTLFIFLWALTEIPDFAPAVIIAFAAFFIILFFISIMFLDFERPKLRRRSFRKSKKE